MNIKDIAKICGVSTSTVSKILNHKDEDISDETRKKVLAIIKEYQFTPYSKVLKKAMIKSNMIGLLVSDKVEGIETVIYEIEQRASDNGYSIILCNSEGIREKAEKYIHILEYKGSDGIILLGQEETIAESVSVPAIVLQSRNVKTVNPKIADIYYEMKDIGYAATKYLIEKGHKKIGAVLWEADEKIKEGYIKAHHEYSMTSNFNNIYYGKELEDFAQIAISEYLSANITAIICSSPQISSFIYEKSRERGTTVPRELSIISIRDDKLASVLTPKLTTVMISAKTIAENAVHTLMEIVEGRKTPHDCRIKMVPEVCERESVMLPEQHKQGGKIVIVGSMNMDCMISVPQIPADGETVVSNNIVQLPGGKGANQAVGSGKLDGLVYMIGRLGNDSDGKKIYNSLVNAGVKMDGVIFDNTMPTGKAYVNVSANGESTIAVYKGANERLDRDQIRKNKLLFEGAKYCLLSLEIAEDTAEFTLKECKKRGVQVILKPSAVEEVKESWYKMVDYFIPNEKELNQLVKGKVSVEKKADILLDMGVKNVIITLAGKGCYLKNSEFGRFFPCADFTPRDTTGGADAFISALAVFLSEGYDIVSAIGFATYAAGINITRYGVQAAMTDRIGLDIYKDEIHTNFRI